MPPDNNQKHFKVKKSIVFIAAAIVLAGLIGWWLGSSSKNQESTPQTTAPSSNIDRTPQSSDGEGVKSLISYTLPDNWKEVECLDIKGPIFIVPAGSDSNIDCAGNPVAPVRLSVDPVNTHDCNELQSQQDVKKHTCISLFINGRKSLKATTEYLDSSSFKKATTINAYYIDIGEKVIKAEYYYNSDNNYQVGFDQLANSIKSKN
jgi:hypothetical protein